MNVKEQIMDDDLHRRIAARAHQLYEARGCQDGNDVQDWLEAENEILPNKSTDRRRKNSRSRSPQSEETIEKYEVMRQ